MIGARRVVASMVGAAVVDGLEMRAAPDDRGQAGSRGQTVKKYKISMVKTYRTDIRYRTVQ